MALEINFVPYSTVNRNYIKILDETGDYNASTNPTGWGAPNATKAQVTVSTVDITYPGETTPVTVNLFASPYLFPQTADRWSFTPGAESTAAKTAITAATNAQPIVVTAASHGLSADDYALVSGVGGNLNANGYWQVSVPTANTAGLLGSNGSGTYSSGGYIQENTSSRSTLEDGVYKFAFSVTAGGAVYTDTAYYLHAVYTEARISNYVFTICGCSCNSVEWANFARMQRELDAVNYAFDAQQYSLAQTLMEKLEKFIDILTNDSCNCSC